MVATRARVYTSCAFIVTLNLNVEVDFDLTLLGHPNSKADLHINDGFVANDGLWLTCPRENGAFRPWHWPMLPTTANLHKSRAEELLNFLSDADKHMPIVECFGFGEAAKARLSRSARAFLHPKKKAEEVTFFDFVDQNVNAVDPKDGTRIIENEDIDKIAQIGAHRISKWLSRLVLGPQDVLIDLPHLVAKLPFLVPKDSQGSMKFWNACVELSSGVVERLSEDISAHVFPRANWFDRPVFWGDAFETDEYVEKLLGALDANPANLVFCEDASAFHPAEQSHRFVAAHHSASDERFVRWVEQDQDVKYGPQSRLAM